MLLDCAIIGGGPAGLNAALVLGRARRRVLVFDDNQPRNAVTQASHGFVTRDGVTPQEFRALAHQELSKYPSVDMQPVRVTALRRAADAFEITTEQGEVFSAQTVLLACTGSLGHPFLQQEHLGVTEEQGRGCSLVGRDAFRACCQWQLQLSKRRDFLPILSPP